ncbi:hypothetical protein TNCV_1267931 [Trichonephila clavipes]|nr:hypothetical protein TNCV_1267931 [Trichonephila clavipes]
MAFLEKRSKVDLQYMAAEMGVEDVHGMRVFELRDAILNRRDGSISSRGSGISKWCSNSRNKQIELEGEGHFARACLDIEVSIDRGNIGNEVSFNFSIETRLKVEVEDRLKTDEEAKAVEEWRKMEEERRMNERIALEGEMRLKKERLLVEEQMRHIQEECKMTMKEEQKCFLEKDAKE